MSIGYWEYAGTRYQNKFRAIEASRGNVKDISFTLFENSPSFTEFDWSIEPQTSLNELMKERALQLRDKYKYLKLFYSGGHDSHTVLNTFLKNNIHVDEIVVYRFAGNNTFEANLGDYEILDYTLPYLKSIQNTKLAKTKITVYDYGYEYYDKYLGEKWFYTKNNFTVRHNYIPRIRGKNFCNIFCSNDPEVAFENGRWYADFWDSSIEELVGFNNIEMFYTSPDLPELHSKQCHLQKHLMIKNNLYTFSRIQRKTLTRNYLRDIPPVVLKPELTKHTHDMFDLPKENLTFKQTFTDEFKDRYKSMVASTKVNGVAVYRQLRGYNCFKFDLGV